MKVLVLSVPTNSVAQAIWNATAKWKSHTLARKDLQSHITAVEGYDAVQTRAYYQTYPLRVTLVPPTLDDVVALANALKAVGILEAPITEIRDYIAQAYPEESIDITLAGARGSARLRNALFRHSFWTVSALCAATDKEILDVKGVRNSGLERIRQLRQQRRTK